MSSYCPVCDRFVDNLDDCDLPYGGDPPPFYEDEDDNGLVDYSDLVSEDDIPSQDDIESNMSYYLVKSGKINVKDPSTNSLYEVDVDSECVGLFRQNAMTFYEELTPYLILARNIENNEQLFYLVKCKDYFKQWVQVDLNVGDNIYNILSKKFI